MGAITPPELVGLGNEAAKVGDAAAECYPAGSRCQSGCLNRYVVASICGHHVSHNEQRGGKAFKTHEVCHSLPLQQSNVPRHFTPLYAELLKPILVTLDNQTSSPRSTLLAATSH